MLQSRQHLAARPNQPMPTQAHTIPLCLPSDITAEQFLAEYWQKKPLLIKNGLPQLVGMFEPDDIIALAQDDNATARLISQQDSQWQLQTSPLSDEAWQNLPAHWTVLVQNLEQWSPKLASLWQAFAFVPQWQRDDIMVSYAPAGGGVGGHYDNYDVFLAQGYGKRRWRLGKMCDTNSEFLPNQPLRVLRDMGQIIFDEVLSAGDVLYVPSNLAHDGVAVDDCLTFSFGCRRPSALTLLDALADVATHDDALAIPLKIVQPPHPNAHHAVGMVAPESLADVKRQLLALLQSSQGDALLNRAMMETVSKRQYDLLLPELDDDLTDLDALAQALADGAGVRQDLAGRMVYQRTTHDTNASNLDFALFINGEYIAPDDIAPHAQVLLRRLADGECLTGADFEAAGVPIDELADWLENGWVWLDIDTETDF